MLIEPFATGWLDELCMRASALAPGQRLHLLIDGAFIPGVHRRIHADRKVMLFSALPGCIGEALDLSPFLMPFAPDDTAACRVLQRCSGWPMVSVIQTDEDLGTLAARMAAWTVIEADGQCFHLRFADTRRIPAIVRALGVEQRAQFLGPATNWVCITRRGVWQVVALDGVESDIATFASLDAQQFRILVEDSRIDELLALYTQRHPAPVMPALLGHDLLALALQAAEKVQLTEPELLAWCEFLWHEGKVETPATAAQKFMNWQATHGVHQDGKGQ